MLPAGVFETDSLVGLLTLGKPAELAEGGAEVVAQPYEINTKQLKKNDLVRSIAALFASLCIICSTFLLRFCGWFNGL